MFSGGIKSDLALNVTSYARLCHERLHLPAANIFKVEFSCQLSLSVKVKYEGRYAFSLTYPTHCQHCE